MFLLSHRVQRIITKNSFNTLTRICKPQELQFSFVSFRQLTTNQQKKVSQKVSEKQYKPPALGVNPAYDEALKYIYEDKALKYAKIKDIEEQISNILTIIAPSNQRDQEVTHLKKMQYELQVLAEINDPEVRWNFKNGKIDMSIPVYRHLREKHWKKEPLYKLMQRITQMYVIPDVFPTFEPTIDLEFKFKNDIIEPGVFLFPAQTRKEPTMILTNFHEEKRLYTLIMVDPDMPDTLNKTYQTEWNWLIINIPLNVTNPDISGGEVILPYIPPHPPKGTKYHRYTLAILEQPNNQKIEIPKNMDRVKNVREFMSEYNLTLRGASFFREVWDKDVSDIYTNILVFSEPQYGRHPKVDQYLDETGLKQPKYTNF
ncbi:phosphatidylethanolamine-binding protein [Glomus cerebriforme]|uniref:Phosphatidylethanolamine-binding protein n=1 Tax=Glomus cerebriforme TaxID=658196 RepID=A0A397T8T7_9GLOM|nr:phosphatidylethanolamine-binding protein [Glomus cerebriforme]